eukprot:5678622-Lingulodinium_polyedra.AAC.1
MGLGRRAQRAKVVRSRGGTPGFISSFAGRRSDGNFTARNRCGGLNDFSMMDCGASICFGRWKAQTRNCRK